MAETIRPLLILSIIPQRRIEACVSRFTCCVVGIIFSVLVQLPPFEIAKSGVLKASVVQAHTCSQDLVAGAATGFVSWQKPGRRLVVSRRAETDPKAVTRLISSAPSMQAVLSVLEEEMLSPVFNEFHIRTAFNRLARLKFTFTPKVRCSPVLADLIGKVKGLMDNRPLEARSSSTIFWAAATLLDKIPELSSLLPQLVETIVFRADDLDARQLSNIIWGCASSKQKQYLLDALLPFMIERAVDQADSMNLQDIANIIWASGKLKDRSTHLVDAVPAMLDVLEPHLPSLMAGVDSNPRGLGAQMLSNIVWAAGQLKLNPAQADPLFQALSTIAEESFRSFTPQGIANVCWGMALCGWMNATFLRSAVVAVAETAPSWRQRDAELALPMIVCSFAKLGVRSGTLLRTVAELASPMLPKMNKWGIAALTWSYEELDTEERFVSFRAKLAAAVARKRISKYWVEKAYLGPEEWHGWT